MNGHWEVSPRHVIGRKPRLRWRYAPGLSFIAGRVWACFTYSWVLMALKEWRRR